jgi:hypothetical protein
VCPIALRVPNSEAANEDRASTALHNGLPVALLRHCDAPVCAKSVRRCVLLQRTHSLRSATTLGKHGSNRFSRAFFCEISMSAMELGSGYEIVRLCHFGGSHFRCCLDDRWWAVTTVAGNVYGEGTGCRIRARLFPSPLLLCGAGPVHEPRSLIRSPGRPAELECLRLGTKQSPALLRSERAQVQSLPDRKRKQGYKLH